MNAHLAKVAVLQIIVRDKSIFDFPIKAAETSRRGGQRKTPQNPVFGIKGKFSQRIIFAKEFPAQNAAERCAGAKKRRKFPRLRRNIEHKLRLSACGAVKKPETPVLRALMPSPAAQKMVVHTHDQRAEEFCIFICD